MSLLTPIPQAGAAVLQKNRDSAMNTVWYRFFSAVASAFGTSDGPKTVVLAKITALGTNGSITYNAQGIVTASVDPT